MSVDEITVPVAPPVGESPIEDEFPKGPGGLELLSPVPVRRGSTPVPLVLTVRIGAVGRVAVPVRGVPVRFDRYGYDIGTLEPLEGSLVLPTLALDVGSGKTPAEEPILYPFLPGLVTTVIVLRFAMLYK